MWAFDYPTHTAVGETELYSRRQSTAADVFERLDYIADATTRCSTEPACRAQCGAINHNVQVLDRNVAGQLVTNEEVLAIYLRAAELGERFGVTPCFEVHINMWSEHFGRVAEVAAAAEARGVKYNMTLDHSHVIFKIDNPEEQAVQGLDADIAAGHVVLDPYA